MKRRRLFRLLIYSGVVLAGTAVAVLLQGVPLVHQMELRTYDYRFSLRRSAPPPRVPITILALDEDSFGRVPDPLMFWQKHFAKVITALAEGQAAVVAIDLFFSDIERWDPEGPQQLAAAMLQASEMPLVLAYRVRDTGVEQPPGNLALAASAVGHTFAYANLTVDPDDFIRRQLLQADVIGGTPAPSFALAVAESYARKKGLSLAKPAPSSGLLIDYRPRGTFPREPFANALDAANRNDSSYFEKFKDRIVLVGLIGGRGGDDLHSTPHYYWSVSAQDGWRTPGVEIHANTVTTLLEGSAIREWPLLWQTVLSLFAALAVTVLWKTLPPVPASGATLLLLILLGGGILWAFEQGVWVWAVMPLLAVACAFGFTQSVNYVLEGRERRRIRELFGRYVSDDVIRVLLARPEGVVLDGERKRVTVLFADIKGFTTRSEASEPEDIVRLLNDYFKEIVDAIMSKGGTVNALVGDGIMAIFGAPIENADSGLPAVQAAQAMMAGLARVNAKLAERKEKPIEIGIGIHAGFAVVGNMGSPRKMEYTAIGDVVNTAARIESETRKVEGADILISATVYESLRGRVPAEFAVETRLKGKTIPMALYKVASLP